MVTLLRLDTSARKGQPLSRCLSQQFIEEWKIRRPGDRLIAHDLDGNPPLSFAESFAGSMLALAKWRSPTHQAEVRLIAEVKQADLIVMATPIYYYGMPSALKAWFDQIIWMSTIFSFDSTKGGCYPLEPILKGKSLVVFTTSGKFELGFNSFRERLNYLVRHIRACAAYLGVNLEKDFYHVGIEHQEFGDDYHQQSIQDAHQTIPPLVEKLASFL
jgi:FMN-dependent NADH-azoreductase